MSALNALIYPDCAVMLTDGATNVVGKIDWIGSKVYLYPHLNAAIGLTAAMPGVSWIVETFVGGCAVSFDDMTDTLPKAVEAGLREFEPEMGARGAAEGAFDILALGFSDREGRFVGRVCSYVPGGEPLMQDAGRIYVQPFDKTLEERLERVGLHPKDILTLPTTQGQADRLADVMEFQRARAAETGHVIGGFQQATILTLDSIVTRVVQRWPDRVHADFKEDVNK